MKLTNKSTRTDKWEGATLQDTRSIFRQQLYFCSLVISLKNETKILLY